MEKNKQEIQRIGIDIGRGYVKAYSEYNGKIYSAMFKSLVSTGRELDFSKYESPICIEYNNQMLFIGSLAEIEGKPSNNSSERKAGPIQRKLLAAALSKIAVAPVVKIMLGIPNKAYKSLYLKEVEEAYKGKIIDVKDVVSDLNKSITIEDISIFRESDSALYWVLKDTNGNTKPCAMVSVGFRSTEIAYFDKGFSYIDRLSDTVNFGNKDILDEVSTILESKNIFKEDYVIDSSDDYDDLKKVAYNNASEKLEEILDGRLENQSEIDIYVCGGTSKHLSFGGNINTIEDPQMATAKGLYLLSTNM